MKKKSLLLVFAVIFLIGILTAVPVLAAETQYQLTDFSDFSANNVKPDGRSIYFNEVNQPGITFGRVAGQFGDSADNIALCISTNDGFTSGTAPRSPSFFDADSASASNTDVTAGAIFKISFRLASGDTVTDKTMEFGFFSDNSTTQKTLPGALTFYSDGRIVFMNTEIDSPPGRQINKWYNIEIFLTVGTPNIAELYIDEVLAAKVSVNADYLISGIHHLTVSGNNVRSLGTPSLKWEGQMVYPYSATYIDDIYFGRMEASDRPDYVNDFDIWNIKFLTDSGKTGLSATAQNMSDTEKSVVAVMVLKNARGAVEKVCSSAIMVLPVGTPPANIQIEPVESNALSAEAFFLDDWTDCTAVKAKVYKQEQ